MKKPTLLKNYDRSFCLLLGMVFSLSLMLSAFQWQGRSLTEGLAPKQPMKFDEAAMVITQLSYPSPPVERLHENRRQGPIETTAAPVLDGVGLETNFTSIPLPQLPVEVDTATDVFVPLVEHYPIFPGGDEALLNYLARHTRYTTQAREHGIQGMVYLQFVVLADGSIDHIRVIRGLGFGLDEEAIRVVRNMPLWQPGFQGGKAVNVAYTLPIRFSLR